MTTVAQIITEAFRESNNIPVGQLPTAAEQAEGLNLFNRFLASVYGNEAGDPLTPLSIGNNNMESSVFYNLYNIPITNWYPPRNARLIFNLSSAQDLNFNPFPNDGERIAIHDASGNFATNPVTLHGNGRLIDGATTVTLNTNSTIKEYFYRADTNTWMNTHNLGLVDPFPFPTEFEDYFIIGLAMRINPRNKQTMDPQSIEAYRRLRSAFRSRYKQITEQRPEEALLRTPNIPYLFYRNYGPFLSGPQAFNLGYYI